MTPTYKQKLELLDTFCRFLEKGGWMDCDWYTEEPHPIPKFLEEQANKGIKLARSPQTSD